MQLITLPERRCKKTLLRMSALSARSDAYKLFWVCNAQGFTQQQG